MLDACTSDCFQALRVTAPIPLSKNTVGRPTPRASRAATPMLCGTVEGKEKEGDWHAQCCGSGEGATPQWKRKKRRGHARGHAHAPKMYILSSKRRRGARAGRAAQHAKSTRASARAKRRPRWWWRRRRRKQRQRQSHQHGRPPIDGRPHNTYTPRAWPNAYSPLQEKRW